MEKTFNPQLQNLILYQEIKSLVAVFCGYMFEIVLDAFYDSKLLTRTYILRNESYSCQLSIVICQNMFVTWN